MRIKIYTILLLLAVGRITAQPLTISNISPSSGPIGTSVTITGNAFSSGSENIVWFGAAKATTVSYISATQLIATVPAGATYDFISVTVTGLTAYSNQKFIVTFSGGGAIDLNSFDTPVNFAANNSPRVGALADIDVDGKIDITATNANSNNISVFRNTSTLNAINSSSMANKVDFIGSSFYSVPRYADFDGDGKLDLAISNFGSISVFRNISSTGSINSSSFSAIFSWATTGSTTGIDVLDVDADGKPDIIASDINQDNFSVYRNISAGPALAFVNEFTVSTGAEPGQIVCGDLDGDGIKDMATANFADNSISTFKNTTASGGMITIGGRQDFSVGVGPQDIKLGDIDNDGKFDLLVTNYSIGDGNSVSVLRNTSTIGFISFAPKVDLTTMDGSFGSSLGDLDGDGRIDIVVGAIGSSGLSIFKNNSISGNISVGSFSPRLDITGAMSPSSVSIGDIDGNSAPELVVTNWTGSSISILRNKNLIEEPTIQASNITFSSITPTSITVNFTNGNGSSRLLVAADSPFFNTDPEDGTSYTPNSQFGVVELGTGGTGDYIVGSGSGPITVVGLTAGYTYYFRVYEFNGSGGSENYNVSTASGNPASQATLNNTFHVSPAGSDSNNGSTASPFLTIQHALTTATAGDIIKVAAGTYNEGLVTQSQITLQGGYASDFLDVNRNIFTQKTIVRAVSTIMLNDANGCVIDGFIFDGNNTAEVGLNISAGSVVRNNVVLRVKSSPGQGINISGNATVVNNNFHDNITGAIIFGGTSATSIFKNNILTNNSFGLNNSSAAGIHRYTCVFGNSFNYTGNFNTPGTGDINLNPQFLNAATDDFRLASTSPAIDAGDPADPVGSETCSSRINMGAYGGTLLASCTVASPPGTQASNITFSSVTTTSITVNFTNGNGTSRLLVARAGSAVNSDPVDGTSYTPNNIFGSIGSELGTGNFVVGNGNSPVTVTGLTPGTTYHFRVYEFNGSGGTENYNITTATGNPNSQATNSATVVTVSSFTPSTATPGDQVTITGANFGATIAANTVFFGGARAVITNASASQLVVNVPPGATHDRIAVVAGNQIGYSSSYFVPTFTGTSSLVSNSFGAREDFSTGNYANYAVIADMNYDGKPDVLVSNGSGGSVSILTNSNTGGTITPGNLTSAVNLFSGTSPNHIAVADMDNDGKLDVVIPNATSGATSVFRSTTTGATPTFATGVDFAGDSPRYVALGDLDGDGKTDMVVSNFNNATLSVFRNTGSTGSISFASAITLTTQTQPYGLAIGDMDGDGRPDLMVANQGSNSISVFRNTSTSGSVSFATAANLTTGTSPQNVALGDIDKDGKLDIAVVCNTVASLYRNVSTSGSLTVSSFTSKFDLSIGTNGIGIALADFTGDGKLDLVTANNATSNLSLFAGTAAVGVVNATSFGAQENLSLPSNPACYSVAVSDLNMDGKPELIVPNGVNNTISVFENLISPTAIQPSAQPTSFAFSNLTSTSFTVDFNAALGNPDGYLALMKEGSAPTYIPVDGQTYSINEEPLAGEYVVNNDGNTSFGVGSLNPSSILYFTIYAFNGSGSGINYLTTGPLAGNVTTDPLPTEPTVQASNVILSQPFANVIQVNWTNGNGTNRIVVAREGGAVNQAPPDGSTWGASSSFTSGDDLADGNYVVYNGNGNSVTVTDIQLGTTYHFFVFEYNGGAGSENYNINTAINNPNSITTAGDTTPPNEIAVTAPGSIASGSNIDITGQYRDDESVVVSVELEYRSVSAGTGFTPLAMTNTSGDNWNAQIPSSAVGELGVEFQITATNDAGLSNTPTLRLVKVDHDGTSGLVIPYSSYGSAVTNYRIVSVPLDLDSKTVQSVFGTHLGAYDGKGWRMYRYENGVTRELTTSSLIEPGKGYWLIIRENKTPAIQLISGSGNTVQSTTGSPFTLQSISDEWYQVGNPYNFNLLWADVQAANPGLPALITYEGNFGAATVLKKFSGGFINFGSGGSSNTIVFPVVKNPAAGGRASSASKHNPIDQSNWQVNLTLRHDDLQTKLGGFGMNEKASEGFDEFDLFTVPRFFDDYLELNHHKRDGKWHYATDIIPTRDSHVWAFSVASTGNSQGMKISWDNSYFGDNDRALYLVDEGAGRMVNMREKNEYTIDRYISGPFKVVFGSEEFAFEHTKAERLYLHRVYPIPADEEITIAFTLPGNTPVAAKVEVLDLLGRPVWQNEAEYASGYNEVAWKCTDEVAGIYIVSIKTGMFREQARIIIH